VRRSLTLAAARTKKPRQQQGKRWWHHLHRLQLWLLAAYRVLKKMTAHRLAVLLVMQPGALTGMGMGRVAAPAPNVAVLSTRETRPTSPDLTMLESRSGQASW
jgi:hypothetical protein